MKNTAVVLGLCLLFFGLNLIAADQPIDFSGTYLQDLEKSEAFPRSISAGGMEGMGGMGGPGMGGPGMGGPGMGGPGMGGPGRGGPSAGGKGVPAPQQMKTQMTLSIEQTAQYIQLSTVVSVNGQAGPPIIEKYLLDGKEISGVTKNQFLGDGKKKTKIKVKKDKFQIIEETTYPPTQMGNSVTQMTREYALSKDGKVLTIKITNIQGFGNTEQKMIYNKQ
jgi:hypothetical protein